MILFLSDEFYNLNNELLNLEIQKTMLNGVLTYHGLILKKTWFNAIHHHKGRLFLCSLDHSLRFRRLKLDNCINSNTERNSLTPSR